MNIGRYQVVRLLGQGGMASVYEATESALNRRVAIKVLHSNMSNDPEVIARFVSEGRIVNGIRHPSLVPVHEQGQLPDRSYYIVMDLLEGETLSRRMARSVHRPMSMEEALRIVRQVAEALATVHRHGVVHRDIKPWNFPLLDLPKFLRGEFRGNTAQLIPRFSRRVNKKIPDGTFGIGLQVRQIHWDFLAYRRYCALL